MIPAIFEFNGKEGGISEDNTCGFENVVYVERLVGKLVRQLGYKSSIELLLVFVMKSGHKCSVAFFVSDTVCSGKGLVIDKEITVVFVNVFFASHSLLTVEVYKIVKPLF